MTLASALYGGGGAVTIPYLPGGLYTARNVNPVNGVALDVNNDLLLPWSPRADVTVDKVAWYRQNTAASNVYVGMYSSAGVLLTDCAVDTNTVAGWHLVDTTNVALVAGSVYYFCLNESVQCAIYANLNLGTNTRSLETFAEEYGHNLAIGSAGTITAGARHGSIYQKARTNAALLSTLTMTGWSDATSGRAPYMGIVVA